MRRLLLAFSLLLTCFGAAAQGPQASQPQPVTTPNLAGKVELVEGDVTVHDRAKKPRKVAVGDTILEGEGIVTGKDGELHLNMEDGGFIAVRPNTKMRIVAYQAQGDEGDKGVFSLLQGTFRSVTGWIGKFNPRSYQVRTPTATIGVRGTDHEPLVIPQGSKEGEPGSYDKVNVGGSFIQTKHGTVRRQAQPGRFRALARPAGAARAAAGSAILQGDAPRGGDRRPPRHHPQGDRPAPRRSPQSVPGEEVATGKAESGAAEGPAGSQAAVAGKPAEAPAGIRPASTGGARKAQFRCRGTSQARRGSA